MKRTSPIIVGLRTLCPFSWYALLTPAPQVIPTSNDPRSEPQTVILRKYIGMEFSHGTKWIGDAEDNLHYNLLTFKANVEPDNKRRNVKKRKIRLEPKKAQCSYAKCLILGQVSWFSYLQGRIRSCRFHLRGDASFHWKFYHKTNLCIKKPERATDPYYRGEILNIFRPWN